MSIYWTKDEVANLGSVDVSGTNSTTAYEAGVPMDVRTIIGVVTVATTGAAGSVITVAVRDADGGNSASYGTFTIPSGLAADSVFRVDIATPAAAGTVASDGSLVYTNEPGVMEVNPGQEFILTSDGGGDAGTVTFFAIYQHQGFNGVRVDGTTDLTFTAA